MGTNITAPGKSRTQQATAEVGAGRQPASHRVPWARAWISEPHSGRVSLTPAEAVNGGATIIIHSDRCLSGGTDKAIVSRLGEEGPQRRRHASRP